MRDEMHRLIWRQVSFVGEFNQEIYNPWSATCFLQSDFMHYYSTESVWGTSIMVGFLGRVCVDVRVCVCVHGVCVLVCR